jgi:hypothetical protein
MDGRWVADLWGVVATSAKGCAAISADVNREGYSTLLQRHGQHDTNMKLADCTPWMFIIDSLCGEGATTIHWVACQLATDHPQAIPDT